MGKKPAITAADISNLLSARHYKDVFVPQCKDGPTIYGSHRRLDAWAMKKSWTNPVVFGYEIKVSRSDFVNDNKWRDYLECCTDFYFVCPSKLIQPNELPAEVGLLWVATTGSMLYTKKKAPSRHVKIPESLFRYILMARCRIVGEYEPKCPHEARAYWQEWLRDQVIDRQLGRRVSRTLSQRIDKEVLAAQRVNEKQAEHLEGLEKMKRMLRGFGIDPDNWAAEYDLKTRLKEVYGDVPPELLHRIKNLKEELDRFTEHLKADQSTLFGKEG